MTYETTDKMVSHPPHYQSNSGLEVIDVIKAFTAELTGIEATDTGNVIKYICRWKNKNGLQDLKKARWYLEHLIEEVERVNNTTLSADQLEGHSIIFDNADDAINVYTNMYKLVNCLGKVTVGDVYRLAGTDCDLDYDQRGWYIIGDFSIKPTENDKYLLVFPPIQFDTTTNKKGE